VSGDPERPPSVLDFARTDLPKTLDGLADAYLAASTRLRRTEERLAIAEAQIARLTFFIKNHDAAFVKLDPVILSIEHTLSRVCDWVGKHEQEVAEAKPPEGRKIDW
jgi:hypothetical protein